MEALYHVLVVVLVGFCYGDDTGACLGARSNT
jgi:hypothetical protein